MKKWDVFVVGTEGLVNEDSVEALNQNRQTLEQERGLFFVFFIPQVV